MARAKTSSHGGEREGAGRPKTVRDDVTAKVDRQVIARAHFVAKSRGVTLAEYLSSTLAPVVERDFTKASQAG